jgi:hypothetical protein
VPLATGARDHAASVGLSPAEAVWARGQQWTSPYVPNCADHGLARLAPVSFRSTGGAGVDIRCDLALIGVGAVFADAGYTTSNLAQGAMIQEMICRVAPGSRRCSR